MQPHSPGRAAEDVYTVNVAMNLTISKQEDIRKTSIDKKGL